MNRKAVLLPLLMAFLVILVFFGIQIPLKQKYDNLRNRTLVVGPYVEQTIGDGESAFLSSVKADWKLSSQEVPDSIFAEICSATGLPCTVQGVVDLYTHVIPPYSFLNLERNGRETTMAMIVALAVPTSVDNRIHVAEGLAFVKITGRVVELFEDTPEGLRRTLYAQQKPSPDEHGTPPPVPEQP